MLLVETNSLHGGGFRALRKLSAVEQLTMDDVYSKLALDYQTQASYDTAPAEETINTAEYTSKELEAITIIKQFWRQRFPKLLEHRKFLSTPEGQLSKRYREICMTHPSRPKVYIVLLSLGVQVSLRMQKIQSSLQNHHKTIMTLLEKADPSDNAYEVLDEHLQALHSLDAALKLHAKRIANDSISEMLERWNGNTVRYVLESMAHELVAMEGEMGQVVRELGKL